MDIDGTDAAQKLAILARLAFGTNVSVAHFTRQGIDTLELADLKYADELGYTVKLLAVAKLVDGQLEMHVQPTLVRHDSPLAQCGGAFNMIALEGDAVGRTWYSGAGAGQMPTASAVVADLIDVATGRASLTFPRMRCLARSSAVSRSAAAGSRQPLLPAIQRARSSACLRRYRRHSGTKRHQSGVDHSARGAGKRSWRVHRAARGDDTSHNLRSIAGRGRGARPIGFPPQSQNSHARRGLVGCSSFRLRPLFGRVEAPLRRSCRGSGLPRMVSSHYLIERCGYSRDFAEPPIESHFFRRKKSQFAPNPAQDFDFRVE